MDNYLINPRERIDDLQTDGLKIIQNPDLFCFGTDAVLLSDYASKSIRKGAKVLDLCCGNGIIPLLLTSKSYASEITGIEIQEDSASLAKRSVELNNLNDKIHIICDDLKNAESIFGKRSFDYITCNPPYKEAGGGLTNKASSTTIARHEILCNLEDIIRVSSIILKQTGKLCMVHRPERLADILCLMRKYKIEPKRLRMVHPSAEKTATMVLVEGAYSGKPKLILDPPLYVYKDVNVFSDEIITIYNRRKSDL